MSDGMGEQRDLYERMYDQALIRYDALGMGVMRTIADGGSLVDVLHLVGDSFNGCDHVDDESIALWNRAMSAVSDV